MNEPQDIALAVFRDLDHTLIALLLTLPRLAAFILLAQIIGPNAMPRLVRILVLLILAAFVMPINLVHVSGFDRSVLSIVAHIFKEAGIGLVLGYLVGWIFWAMQSAGIFIDTQRGAAIGGVIDPLHGQDTTPLGAFFLHSLLAYIYVSGAAYHVFLLIFRSYEYWPVTQLWPPLLNAFPAFLLSVADDLTRTTLIIAGPIVAIMFITEMALALISRFAPQIQVFILSMPIKSGLTMLILVFYISRLMPQVSNYFFVTEGNFSRFYGLLD